jgi:DNA-binding response OmpR family regulator
MKKVVVIAKDKLTSQVLAMIFEAENYKVTLISDAQSLVQIRHIEPHLLIIDEGTFRPDCMELYREIKAIPCCQHTPIVLLSSTTASEHEAKKLGALVIQKPLRIKMVKEMAIRAVAIKTLKNAKSR